MPSRQTTRSEDGHRRKKLVKGEPEGMTKEEFDALALQERVALIQELIPLGLMAVAQELQREVDALAGGRHQRDSGGLHRFGTNPGTVVLGGQRVPIRVPRVRGEEGEVQLQSYELLHRTPAAEATVFQRVLHGLSCRTYAPEGIQRPGSIGASKSTVSRQFVEASRKALKAFEERDLSGLEVVAMFVDGKAFATDQMVIALGVTQEGSKRFLGFVQADTENRNVLTQFFQSLLDRGLDVSPGVLAVIDGAKGISSALKAAFKRQVLIQRCQWHKRENVVSYLSRGEQTLMRRRLQRAYQKPTYNEAHKALQKLHAELENRNQSAAASLSEGLEETLTLHRLGVFGKLGASFKTTNCIESVNARAEQLCGKVDVWKNSSQKQRWLASALLDIEPKLRRVRGSNHLPELRDAIQREINQTAGRPADTKTKEGRR